MLQGMAAPQAYTQKKLYWAVNLSAFLGWLIVVAYLTYPQSDPGIWLMSAIIGLPVSYLVSWSVVAPTLRKIMRHPISWARAAYSGAKVSLLIATMAILIGRFLGWLESISPNISSQVGGGDRIRSIDGILTPYGWLMLAQSTVLFILGGVAIALILRAVIGPGEAPRHSAFTDT
ncbi:hypothetical protein [Hoeflea sp.]|uniref:hypothetical protein n=1 Tax=Hoeflea sp. TaxID=1940281 RepID=UPI003BB156CA